MEQVKKFLGELFSLQNDRASLEEIRERIYSGGQLKGTNMCILILAIFIASIGLNMNSTAVIIGAMLISPLMGVIMSAGYAMASYDSEYVKESILKLIFQVTLSILASAFYFSLSPITTASSELLARTEPTIWDVLIAIFGGFAGIIGSTRQEKSNVIPGVAIATALMPPLCTAGYGLANHSFKFFFGALYLFFINSFFICLTTFIILKLFKIPVKQYVSENIFKRQKIYLTVLGIIVVIPSLYMAYQSVRQNIVEVQTQVYLAKNFDAKDLQVVSHQVDVAKKNLEITLVGRSLRDEEITALTEALKDYSQLSGYKLLVVQNDSGMTSEQLQSMIREQLDTDKNKTANFDEELKKYKERSLTYAPAHQRLTEDLKILKAINQKAGIIFPQFVKVEGAAIPHEDAKGKITYEKFFASVSLSSPMNGEETKKFRDWLTAEVGLPVILTTELIAPANPAPQ